MALGDIIHQKKIVESMIKRPIDQEERGNNYFGEFVEKINSSLSQFTQQMLIDSRTRPELKRVSSIGRGRGLSVSLKKQTPKSLILSGKNIMVNPQFLDVQKQIRQRRVKIAETLMKTAHTVGDLDKSVNALTARKTDIDGKTTKLTKAVSTISTTTHYNQGQFSQRTINNTNTQIPYTQQSTYTNIIESVYDIRISSPKKFIQQSQKHSVSSPNKNASNKLKDMRERQFLRTMHCNKNVCEQNNIGQKMVTDFVEKDSLLNNELKRRPILSNNNLLSIPQPSSSPSTKNPINNNKNYTHLQKMISKTMINSIIISHHHNQQQNDQPQSPVLRLKRRLQMNSINCIFQRQTIVSQYQYGKNDQSMMRQSLMEVQQSFIVHRSVIEDLVKINEGQKCLFYQQQHNNNNVTDDYYCRYLAVEKNVNLLLTVKQMPLQRFDQFVNQLRVYEEIQVAKFRLTEQCANSILQLIRHSTEESKHLMLKAPFTSTLKKHLNQEKIHFSFRNDNNHKVNAMVQKFLSTIQKTINELQSIGVTLNRQPRIQDFVIVFDQIKIENLSMFSIGKYHLSEQQSFHNKQKTSQFIHYLRQQMYQLLNTQ